MRYLRFYILFFLSILFAAYPSVATAQQAAPPVAATPQTPPELIIDQIKKAVVFLQGTYISHTGSVGVQGAPVAATLSGTGFLIFVRDPRLSGDRGETFLVTNKHMIREPGPNGELGQGPYFANVSLRMNTKTAAADGTQFSVGPVSVVDDFGSLEWFVDSDETVDLAITPMSPNPEHSDFKTISSEMFATEEVLKKEHVNENDEILFTGLFAWSPGAKKNYPIVRHGKLARLLDEGIPLDRSNPEKMTAVHLAEVMSFGGNSGSPVFLRLAGIREGSQSATLGYSYYLLGVMQGFFPEGMDFTVQIAELKGLAA